LFFFAEEFPVADVVVSHLVGSSSCMTYSTGPFSSSPFLAAGVESSVNFLVNSKLYPSISLHLVVEEQKAVGLQSSFLNKHYHCYPNPSLDLLQF
jgi:hypothetical protein